MSWRERWLAPGPEETILVWTVAVGMQAATGGYYSAPAIVATALACVALAVAGDRSQATGLAELETRLGSLLLLASGVLCLLTFLRSPLMYAGPNHVGEVALAAGVCALFALYRLRHGQGQRGATYAVVGASALLIVARVMVVIASPSPLSDAWTLQQEGADVLLSMGNPYSHDYTQIYEMDRFGYRSHFGYTPITAFWGAAFRFAAGDVRFGYILADVISSVLLTRVVASPRGSTTRPFLGAALGLAYLANPIGLWITEHGFHEPLMVALTLWAVLLWQGSRPGAGVVLGLAAWAKQTSLVWLVLGLVKGHRRSLIPATLIVLLSAVPFLLADAEAFVRSIITGLATIPPINFSFTLWMIPYNEWGLATGDWWWVGATALAAAAACWAALREEPRRVVVGAVFVLWVLFLTSRQSFGNYHFFVDSMLLLVAARSIVDSKALPRRGALKSSIISVLLGSTKGPHPRSKHARIRRGDGAQRHATCTWSRR